MFEWLKRPVRKRVETLLSPYLNKYTPLQLGEIAACDKAAQLLLSLKYQELFRSGIILPFDQVGLRSYSQNDEDGILIYIFAVIGTTNKKSVELCAGDGIENNTANLIINHGWAGLMFDGNEANVERGRKFYSQCKDTWLAPPNFVHAWIEKENVNSLIVSEGYEGEIDLLSLDLDGVDYWIWRAIDCINPRLIVLEYQPVLGPRESLTIPYERDFNRYNIHAQGYWGASLPAFVKLGREKGYRLIGCNRNCINAFFMRNDVGADIFPEIDVASCFAHPRAQHRMKTLYPEVRHLPWIEV